MPIKSRYKWSRKTSIASKKGGGRISGKVREQLISIVDKLIVKYPLKKDNSIAQIVIQQIPVSARTARTYIKQRRRVVLEGLESVDIAEEFQGYRKLNSIVQEDLWSLYEQETNSYNKAQILSQVMKNKKEMVDIFLRLGWQMKIENKRQKDSIVDRINTSDMSPPEKRLALKEELENRGIFINEEISYASNTMLSGEPSVKT